MRTAPSAARPRRVTTTRSSTSSEVPGGRSSLPSPKALARTARAFFMRSGDGGGRLRVERELPRFEECHVVFTHLERLEPRAARKVVGQRDPGRHPPEPELVVGAPARARVKSRHV